MEGFPEKLLNWILKNEWSYKKEDGGLKIRKHSTSRVCKCPRMAEAQASLKNSKTNEITVACMWFIYVTITISSSQVGPTTGLFCLWWKKTIYFFNFHNHSFLFFSLSLSLQYF